MGKAIIRKPDGTTKEVEVKTSNAKPIPSSYNKVASHKGDEDNEGKKRAKPIVTKAGLTKEKEAYKYGGNIKFE